MWSIMFQGFSWVFMAYLELQDCSFPLGTICRAPIRLSYFAVSSDILSCARFCWNLLTWNDQESCTSLVHTGHLNAYRILCSVWGVYFLCVVVSDGWQESGESRQVYPWCRREYSQDRISLCYRGTNWWTLLEQEAVIRSSSIRQSNGYNLGGGWLPGNGRKDFSPCRWSKPLWMRWFCCWPSCARSWVCQSVIMLWGTFFFRDFISSIWLKVTPEVMSLAMATWLDILEAKSVPWWSELQT